MDRLIAPNTVATGSGDAPPGTGTPGEATDGNIGSGIAPTVFPAYAWNAMQREMVAAIQDAGITLDRSDTTQLRQAIRRLAGRNVTSLSATATLTLDQQGLVLVSASGGNVTLTLPAANAAARPIGYDIVRTDSSANSVTVQRAGSDLIEGASSIALLPGERIGLAADASANWRAVAEGRFAASVGASGWQKMPSGLILQWGSTANGNLGAGAPTTFTGTLPITFPNACLFITGGVFNSGTAGTQEAAGMTDLRATTTTVTAYIEEWSAVAQTVGVRYLAIGN